MADNYLEKKMEDLRSGRLMQMSRAAARRGAWSLDYPCRRVLVTDGACAIGRAVIGEFCRAGCKVAFCDTDDERGRATAYATGARFIHGDVRDAAVVAAAVADLGRAWRDIDVVVNTAADGDGVLLSLLAENMASLRRSLPYPNDFGGRVIDITGEECGDMENAHSVLSEHRITVNRIVIRNRDVSVRCVAQLCVFLSAPGIDFINGVVIPADVYQKL